MTKEELPFLNLDTATSLYLPLEPIEARAHYRFAFRLANGDEEWLLARLCVVEPDNQQNCFNHVVVLRPENAEEDRIFVAENLWYKVGRREIENWMTLAAAKKFKWDLFEQSFNDNNYQRLLFRCWFKKEFGKITLLELGANGWGKINGFVSDSGNSIHGSEHESFIWKEGVRGENHGVTDLKFLRVKDANFKRKARSLWNDENSQIRYAIRWMHLTEVERNAIAFETRNGNWQELKEIAASVLQLRVANIKRLSVSEYEWDFVDYGYISVEGAPQLKNDDALFLWRFAITHAFGTLNIGAEGVKIDSLPLPLWSYISDYDSHEKDIKITTPSMHEILEAKLKLDAWTKAHFTSENAQILMDSLKSFSEEDAQKFCVSLPDSDSQ